MDTAPAKNEANWPKSIWPRERIQDMAAHYAKGGDVTAILVDFSQEVCRLKTENAALQKSLDVLYGVPFSDRCYHALKSRAEKAESRVAGLPEIICLCGSTRFMDAFHEANRRFSLEGKIVLTVEIVTYDGATDPQRADLEQKRRLDELHLRKIDLSDRVHVLNVGGYIGNSTRSEINYAEKAGKLVTYLELPHPIRGARHDLIIIDDCTEASNEQ